MNATKDEPFADESYHHYQQQLQQSQSPTNNSQNAMVVEEDRQNATTRTRSRKGKSGSCSLLLQVEQMEQANSEWTSHNAQEMELEATIQSLGESKRVSSQSPPQSPPSPSPPPLVSATHSLSSVPPPPPPPLPLSLQEYREQVSTYWENQFTIDTAKIEGNCHSEKLSFKERSIPLEDCTRRRRHSYCAWKVNDHSIENEPHSCPNETTTSHRILQTDFIDMEDQRIKLQVRQQLDDSKNRAGAMASGKSLQDPSCTPEGRPDFDGRTDSADEGHHCDKPDVLHFPLSYDQSQQDSLDEAVPCTRLERSQRISLPGAYAQAGPGALERRISRENELPAEFAGEISLDELSSVSRPPADNDDVSNNNQDSIPSADLVSNAEPIFYAEDVRRDFLKRNRYLVITLGCIATAIIVVLCVILISRANNATFEEIIDPLCRVNAPTYQTVPIQCYCKNTTKDYLSVAFHTREQNFYDFLLDQFQISGLINLTANLDIEGCEPANQVLLIMSTIGAGNLTLDTLQDIPTEFLVDVYVLLIIFITMDGIHWTQNENWLNTTNMCEVYGVDCSFDYTFSDIALPANGLKGTIPTEIQYLDAIRSFDISENVGIVGKLPSELAKMTSLEYLNLHGCSVRGTIDSNFGNLQRVYNVDLGSNFLTGTIPAEMFAGLSSLLILDLSENKLTGTLPISIGNLTRLDSLKLQNNKLSGGFPSSFAHLASLGLLDISYNHFSGPVPSVLGKAQLLSLINLYESGFNGSLPETFCSNNTKPLIRSRDVVVSCSVIQMCKCCKSNSHNSLVHVRCADSSPSDVIGF